MKKIFVANWKMNKSKKEVQDFFKGLKGYILPKDKEVIIAPSFALLDLVYQNLDKSGFSLGAQNMFFADFGAFTGEVSPQMLVDNKVKYVILGHSERRQYFFETDSFVNKKTLAALRYKLKPIICIGETLEQKQAGITQELLKEQLLEGLKEVATSEFENIKIAYEPVWAIGTGRAMGATEAQDIASFILNTIQQAFGTNKGIEVLYGGSVNSNNIKDYIYSPSISGALIGTSSLEVEEFKKIIG